MIIPVKKLTVVTLKDYMDELLTVLGEMGVVELKKLSQGEIIGFKETVSEDLAIYAGLWDRFKNLYSKICGDGCPNIRLYTGKITSKVDHSLLDAKLKSYEFKLLSKINEIENLVRYLRELEEKEPIAKVLLDNDINPANLGEYENIFAIVGFIPSEKEEKVKQTLGGLSKIIWKLIDYSENEKILFITALIELKDDIQKFLEMINFKEITFPKTLPKEKENVLKWFEEEKSNVRDKITTLTNKLEEDKKDFLNEADYLKKAILTSYKIASVQNNLLESQTMRVLTGWVPEDQLPRVDKVLQDFKKKTSGKLIVTYSSPSHDDEVPTIFRNPKLFRAYESLIRQYGIPNPREIDPTIIAGILWSIMFGYMFPDWGEGIVIILLGLTFVFMKRDQVMGMRIKSLGKLMIGAGISATIFGLLTGSFFLLEGFPFEPLWPGLRPGWLEIEGYNTVVIIWLLKIAIYIGIAELTLGLLLNIYVEFKNGHKLEALLGEHGLAGLLGFLSLILLSFELLGSMAPGDGALTIIPENPITGKIVIPGFGQNPLTYIPLATLLLSLGLIYYKFKIEGEGAITGASVLFETVLSFLTNTLSFARLAGFAISHVAFAVVIVKLAELFGVAGHLVSFIALNAFVLTLELIVVMIQALRLTFYEFLTKFYRGTGVPFKPFKI